MEHVPFEAAVDPRGYLEAMVKAGYIHGEENIVEYYVRQLGDDGNKSFVKTNPQVFRIGDLVDVQLLFVVVPLKERRYKMITMLRSIALIDGSFSQLFPTLLRRLPFVAVSNSWLASFISLASIPSSSNSGFKGAQFSLERFYGAILVLIVPSLPRMSMSVDLCISGPGFGGNSLTTTSGTLV
ncbi:hypothetical protein BD779DRAFT_1676825 [Infundibulicybe gibba]|nr:hypothetical protein BD779DRAFT_1676825 [Infundibulicybe gibba]